ncbi:MAG: cation transporter [Oscillospiraceae bacterium]
MKKTYNIEVDCAACADKMEAAAQKVEGVKSAAVSFMALRMMVEFEEGADETAVMKAVLKSCRRIERDCNIEF